MRIVDAFWEKRNLSVDCVEITIEKHDILSQLEEICNQLNTIDYVVVKVPVARIDINEYLTKQGFIFVEGSVNFQLNVKDAILSPLQQRLNAAITYSEMEENDLAQLYTEIENGLFKTDRILFDSYFTEKQAATRYINWIKDELTRTTQAYKIVYKEDAIGFFTFKEVSENTYYPFLAGLYEKYTNSGLGFTTLRKPIEEVIRRNGKSISTFASTNNPLTLRSATQQGYNISNINYVFIKHNKIR